jgi:4-diphosphocytidyl-2-C-methyl-D-erythritol kinase
VGSQDDQTLTEFAPAKVNLTLRITGRRPDGYHELESLVAFADLGDRVSLTLGAPLQLVLQGPTAARSGPPGDNLVLKAARALSARVAGLRLGRFHLRKRLPVAAGLGGGSADAAAALRLLARGNDLAPDNPWLLEAAAATGADVSVCLDRRPRLMRGIGELLSAPLHLPPLPALLVNPGVAVATADVFAALAFARGEPIEPSLLSTSLPRAKQALLSILMRDRNDLEPAAIQVQPVIAEVLTALRALPGAALVRMSGSGATCFALCDSRRAADAAARSLRAAHPAWWVKATTLREG